MKILFISQYFFPENFKGNEIVYDWLAKGYEVTVLTAKPNYPKGKFYKGYSFFSKSHEKLNNLNIIRVPVIPRFSGKPYQLFLNYISFVIFSIYFIYFKLNSEFNFIFVQQLSPITMALPAVWFKKKHPKIPLYIWILDLWPESIYSVIEFNNKFLKKILNNLSNYIYRNSDIILISSKSFENQIKVNLGDINKPIYYLPNWAEIFFENHNGVKTPLQNIPLGFNIIFAGNIGEAQDFENILNAAELTINEKINWILIGDGRKLNWVKSEIEKKKINNIYILGSYQIEEMPAILYNADALLVTLKKSYIFNKTVPAKLQAYMALGKIILGAVDGETKDLINNNNIGVASESGNPVLLANNAIRLKNLNKSDIIKIEMNSYDLYYSTFSKTKILNNLNIIIKNNIKINN
jgi:glycosyltransferase involved in cell wall biosynthesis